MDARYYCDVENKARFTAKTLEEIAAYLCGCFSADPLKLYEWRNAGEKGVLHFSYGFASATIGTLEPTPEGPAKHDHDPLPFGRRVMGCPRCEQLARGAAPVKGWGARKKEQEAEFTRALKAHDCVKSNCGPVCTFGDW